MTHLFFVIHGFLEFPPKDDMASELEDIANRPDSPKPREELSYQEVYPDLNVKVQLPMLASAATLKKFSQDLKAMKENESENSLKLDERQMHYIRYKGKNAI